jgi:hypothetical protein
MHSHEKRLLALSRPSVRQSVYVSANSTGRFTVIICIGDFYENLLRAYKFS